MIQKLALYIRKKHMIAEGDHVLAGVSGGADSVCLLLALLELRASLGCTVSAVHVEHGIRGEDSRRDADFVQQLCRKKGIGCHVYACSVPDYAREHSLSEEEAGRILRYDCFSKEKHSYEEEHAVARVRIAVAHNRDDNVETVLFHMARGTGLRGLGGIPPVRGAIIRPLLCVSRSEIEAYLREQGQAYCIDATNESLAYSRNRIRHTVMPALVQVNTQAGKHIEETAAELREINEYLDQQAELALKECCELRDSTAFIDKKGFDQLPQALQPILVHRLLVRIAGSGRDFAREHVRSVQELMDRQVGRRMELPYGLTALREYGGMRILGKEAATNEPESAKKDALERFSFEIIEKNTEFGTQISEKKYTKCFDYDKIKGRPCIRHRQPGDYLVINESGDRQKLKKYLVNEKIPGKEREKLLLLADGAHVMWVVGYRISSYYKVDAHTKKIMKVTFDGGDETYGK